MVIEAIVENLSPRPAFSRSSIASPRRSASWPRYIVHLHHQDCRRSKRADKVTGMHFMNPVPVMVLVESSAHRHVR